MRHHVTTKIVLVITLALTCLALLILGFHYRQLCLEALRVQADCRSQLQTAFLEGRSGSGQDKDDLDLVQDVSSAQRDSSIPLPDGARLISLSVPSGVAGSSATVFDETRSSEQSDGGDLGQSASFLLDYLSPMPETAAFPIPLSNGHQVIARIDFHTTRSRQGAAFAVEIQGVFLGFVALLAGVCWCLHRWVTRPAAAVIRLSRSIVHGDRNIRLSVESQDEFGQIIQAYNDLIDDLFTTQHQADTDGLTQLFNHRYLHEKIGEAISQAKASEHAMAVILIDLDKFKLLNDIYGHLTGDRYLRQTGDVLRRAVHLDGIAGRYGGDEFLIVLPHADAKRASQMEQRVRSLMAREEFRPHPLADPLPLAFSLGVAVYPEHGADPQELIAYADAALYMEKNDGFNIVEFTRQVEAQYLKSQPATQTQRPGKRTDTGNFKMLFNLVVAVDKRDSYTKRHSEHVAQLAVRLACAIGLSEDEQQTLQIAGLLHDVGKIGVPDTILCKPGALSEEEYSIMKGHVVLGERLIQGIPGQTLVQEIVACHHERWDGRGYPEGRLGPQMPLAGRILGIVDAFSAMSLDRPYRSGMALDEICHRLRAGAGTQFDPALVEPLIGVVCAASEKGDAGPVRAASRLPQPSEQLRAA